MSTDSRIADCACFNARRAARTMGQIYDRALKSSGLTNTQFSLLAMAQGRGPISITKLAAALGMERSTLSRNLRVLERSDLVRTGRGQDARVRAVALTEAGVDALAAATPLWRKAQAQVVAAMGQDEWPVVLEELRTMSRQGEALLATDRGAR